MTPLLLAAPLLFAAPVPKDFKPSKTDAERIIGLWEIVVSNHREKPNPGSVGIQYEFQKNGVCVIVHQDKSRHPVKYFLDSKGKPKTYRWVCPWGTWNGVYELDGDALKLAAVGEKAGDPPPAAQPGRNVEYSVLRRIKE
jgi:uncharacterized protein (TIGR03067 family)